MNKLDVFLIVFLLVSVFLMFSSAQRGKDVSVENQRLIKTFLERQQTNKNAILDTQRLILLQCKK